MRKRALYIMVALLVFMPSCSKQEGEDYYPKNSKGSRCEYSVEFMVPFGGVQKGKASVRNDGEETINGLSYSKYVTVYSGIPGAEPDVSYYRRTQDGIYKIDGKHRDAPEYLETPFPLSVGSAWTVRGPEGELFYRVDTLETAELFDKKYENCLKISFQGSMMTKEGQHLKVTGYSYRAPGVGEVKSITVFEATNKVTVDSVLESCR